MAWISLVITLLAHCTGTIAQTVVIQESSLTTTPGETVTLTCGSSTGTVTSSNCANWVQEKSHQVFTSLIGDTNIRVPGVPARFSGSLLRDKAALTITGVQPEDEAVYFCALRYSDYTYVFGGGTQVTVVGGPKSTPKVTVFPPSPEELQTNKATLVCLANDFYPGAATVTWKANGETITNGVMTTKPIKEGQKYIASSYLRLTADQWRSHNRVTCQVSHEGDTVEKSLSPAECL